MQATEHQLQGWVPWSAKMGSHMKRFELLRKFIVYQLPVKSWFWVCSTRFGGGLFARSVRTQTIFTTTTCQNKFTYIEWSSLTNYYVHVYVPNCAYPLFTYTYFINTGRDVLVSQNHSTTKTKRIRLEQFISRFAINCQSFPRKCSLSWDRIPDFSCGTHCFRCLNPRHRWNRWIWGSGSRVLPRRPKWRQKQVKKRYNRRPKMCLFEWFWVLMVWMWFHTCVVVVGCVGVVDIVVATWHVHLNMQICTCSNEDIHMQC